VSSSEKKSLKTNLTVENQNLWVRDMVEISKEELEDLYLHQKLSCRNIGKLLGCTGNKVSQLLKQSKIKFRTKQEEGRLIKHPIKYKISKNELEVLYWKNKLSSYQIARLYGCSPGCIFNKMDGFKIPLRKLKDAIELSIPRRSRSIARSTIKHKKSDFNGSKEDKAYLIGFRLGDLHVQKNKYGETIYVSSGTSKQAQLDLMNLLFENYGYISMYKLKTGCIQFNCYLNMSFDFLLLKEDKIPQWILDNNKFFISFLAGYIDAEGHFGVYNNFAEFSIGSYDANILFSIYQKLNEIGIYCNEPKIRTLEGFVDKRGVRWNGTMYRLRLTRKDDLLNFIRLIKPHIKHAKRFNDICKAEINIIERNKSI